LAFRHELAFCWVSFLLGWLFVELAFYQVGFGFGLGGTCFLPSWLWAWSAFELDWLLLSWLLAGLAMGWVSLELSWLWPWLALCQVGFCRVVGLAGLGWLYV